MISKAFGEITTRLSKRAEQNPHSNYSQSVLRYIGQIGLQADSFEAVRRNRNPLDTDAAHARKVANAARDLKNEAARVDARISDVYSAGLSELLRDIDKQAGIEETKYSAEIRQALRSMSEQQRAEVMHQAMREGNSEIISAVSLAPSLLTGVNPDLVSTAADHVRRTKAPELMEAWDLLNEVSSTATSVLRMADNIYNGNYNAAEQQRIDVAEQAANAAEQQLKEAVASQ